MVHLIANLEDFNFGINARFSNSDGSHGQTSLIFQNNPLQLQLLLYPPWKCFPKVPVGKSVIWLAKAKDSIRVL